MPESSHGLRASARADGGLAPPGQPHAWRFPRQALTLTVTTMPLDFARAAQLFMGTESELASGLGITVADLRASRTNPDRVPAELLVRLGRVLEERGRGMTRVGQMLQEDGG